jgi:hypothetical protein
MFRYSICDPLKKEPIEMGEIDMGKIMDVLDKFPWAELLAKMEGVKDEEIYFSPAIEFENKDNHHGVTISIVEDGKGTEFDIFFRRPKMVSKLFGLRKYMDNTFITDRTGQTVNDVREAVKALINEDIATLESRWG